MQIYMEHFKALVSIIQLFNAHWCKKVIGLILQSFIFQHVTILYLFIRISQSFLHSHPSRWMGLQFSFSKTAKKSSFFINWRAKTPQEIRLTSNFKNEVNLRQQTFRSKWRPSSDRLMCLIEYMPKTTKRSHFSMLFSAATRISICKVIWSSSEHWYQTLSF